VIVTKVFYKHIFYKNKLKIDFFKNHQGKKKINQFDVIKEFDVIVCEWLLKLGYHWAITTTATAIVYLMQ